MSHFFCKQPRTKYLAHITIFSFAGLNMVSPMVQPGKVAGWAVHAVALRTKSLLVEGGLAYVDKVEHVHVRVSIPRYSAGGAAAVRIRWRRNISARQRSPSIVGPDAHTLLSDPFDLPILSRWVDRVVGIRVG